MMRYTVTLPREVAEHLEQLGGGNISAGIREAYRQITEEASEK